MRGKTAEKKMIGPLEVPGTNENRDRRMPAQKQGLSNRGLKQSLLIKIKRFGEGYKAMINSQLEGPLFDWCQNSRKNEHGRKEKQFKETGMKLERLLEEKV